MIAVILAAGMAKRLRPLTDNKPKCLLKVGDLTLLQRSVDSLVAAGISEFVVVTGYLSAMITGFLEGHYPQLTFHFIDNPDYATTNNIYSLWLARTVVEGRQFILLDSDLIYDGRIISKVMDEEASVLTVSRHPLGEEEMKVVVDSECRITEISKTCDPAAAMGESVGIEKINADYSTALYRELRTMMTEEGLTDVFYELAFQRLIAQGFSFKVMDVTDFFTIELDTPEDFDNARHLIPKELY